MARTWRHEMQIMILVTMGEEELVSYNIRTAGLLRALARALETPNGATLTVGTSSGINFECVKVVKVDPEDGYAGR